MADTIPFVTGEDVARLIRKVYADSELVRVPLDRAPTLLRALGAPCKIWLDPGVDGLDDLDKRRKQAVKKKSSWFELISGCANYEKIGAPPHEASPSELDAFVGSLLDRCLEHKPYWLTIPQIPIKGTNRNKINRGLAAATIRWKASRRFDGKLILPLVFTHQSQISGKTARNPRLQQAERCYHEAGADGIWVVDSSLVDDSGSSTLRKRLRAVVDLHLELNARLSPKIRIAGPYWGLNLVLWAKGLVDYPAIGIGSGYQFFLAGSPITTPSPKVALSSLRRRVGVDPQLANWLEMAAGTLSTSHPAHAEFIQIRKQLTFFREYDTARAQVAGFYKSWFEAIARIPAPGRSVALFQDLSAAYVLGKSLPALDHEGPARRPESVAEPLMLSCL